MRAPRLSTTKVIIITLLAIEMMSCPAYSQRLGALVKYSKRVFSPTKPLWQTKSGFATSPTSTFSWGGYSYSGFYSQTKPSWMDNPFWQFKPRAYTPVPQYIFKSDSLYKIPQLNMSVRQLYPENHRDLFGEVKIPQLNIPFEELKYSIPVTISITPQLDYVRIEDAPIKQQCVFPSAQALKKHTDSLFVSGISHYKLGKTALARVDFNLAQYYSCVYIKEHNLPEQSFCSDCDYALAAMHGFTDNNTLEVILNNASDSDKMDIGNLYLNGDIVIRDISKAARIYSCVPLHDALTHLERIYGEDGLLPDSAKMVELYEQYDTVYRSPYILRYKADYYYSCSTIEDKAKSLKLYTELDGISQPPDSVVILRCAELYADSTLVEYDFQKAAEYYSRLALYGNSTAANILAVAYYEGVRLTTDYNSCYDNLVLASTEADPLLCFNLGKIFYKGDAISKDLIKADYLFSRAEQAGITDAAKYHTKTCKKLNRINKRRVQ